MFRVLFPRGHDSYYAHAIFMFVLDVLDNIVKEMLENNSGSEY